jgi:Nif-specific regulatory protein
MSEADLAKELAAARKTIQEQELQLAELRDQQADSRFANTLRELLLMTGTINTIEAPAKHDVVLDDIVETAANVMRAQAASLFLLDEERNELIFEVALGEKADSVRHFRVPVGRGIAGYVALTGQPIAVADAIQDPRFASEIGKAIGYVPKTILCVPLYLNGRVTGVLELLDKAGGTPFSSADMELLVRFANLAALALHQSRLIYDLRRFFRQLLGEITHADSLRQPLAGFADRTADYAGRAQAFTLAKLVHNIGESAGGHHLAVELLSSVARFLGGSEKER